MKQGFGVALVLGGCLMAGPWVCAQAQNDSSAAGQKKTDEKAKTPAQQQATPQTATQSDSNAFPEDTSTVPVMPNKLTDVPAGTFDEAEGGDVRLPEDDLDPVRSPDGEGAAAESSDPARESSSSVNSLDSLLPKPGEDDTGRRKMKAKEPDHPETSTEDISVGKYYLEKKNWKAAQSRFQSALVLAPEEPEVYWGLAESARHLGNFAEARTNYLKVIEYDPDSKHAKEAQKTLKEPELAGAK
jgi:tetratricopeptide (TPR) repeat protein